MKIVSPQDFPLAWLRLKKFQVRKRGNQGSKDKTEYLDVITAFDIETTRIKEIEQSVMYVWQWAWGTVETGCEYVVIGRTWEEFRQFKRRVSVHLSENQRIMCFVHNLSYEFCWLRGLDRYDSDEVFAVKPRKILYCKSGHIEFRCSYLHSNMSLRLYLKTWDVEHKKLSGKEYDYSKRRFPWTPLSEKELAYCANDVAGLVEAIGAEMQHDDDNLYTFPLTSTGYVRRDAKRAMKEVSHSYITAQLPSMQVIEILREAFRGGNCHANRYLANRTIHALKINGEYNIHSADRSSSYPDIVCNCPFPVSEFQPHPFTSLAEVLKLMYKRKRAVIARVKLWGVQLKESDWGCPYLARDKCRNIRGRVEYDNGRILQAEYLETSITDIDLRIIADEYTWDNVEFFDVYSARYGKLPKPLIDMTVEYYRLKTELKKPKKNHTETPEEKREREQLYTKSKNKLNAIYGMMAQWVLKEKLLYLQDMDGDTEQLFEEESRYTIHEKELDQGRPLSDQEKAEIKSSLKEAALEKYNKKAYLLYQWGCWVTAWARYRLEEGIKLAHGPGVDFLYCDTDSVKYIGDIDWTSYNKDRIRDSIQSGAHADDSEGVTHYMGVYEREHDMCEFRTQGAKKYVSRETPDSPLLATISGVVKYDEEGNSVGGAELEAAGGIEAFRDGFTFVKGGGLEAVYNDKPYGPYEIDGHTIDIGPNVVLRESTYTLGRAADYIRLLEGIDWRISIDNQEVLQ